MSDACTILTTCGSEETALTIAAALVDQAYAACVNIIPGIKSYYYFKGETHLDEEVMLIIKTTQDLFPQVSDVITDLHTYEVPEILMFPVQEGSEPFLDWIRQSVKRLA
jgi:periplasmic divalent cation tolerance protein